MKRTPRDRKPPSRLIEEDEVKSSAKSLRPNKAGNSNSLDGLMFAIDGPSGSRCENASNQKPNSSGNRFFLVI